MNDSPTAILRKTLPETRRTARCPQTIPCCPLHPLVLLPCRLHSDLITTIIHLNDGHGWTREKIADWLDTLDLDLSFPTGGNS